MARILLLSDIHANLYALNAVRLYAESKLAVDETWVLGDTLGYGPFPVQTWAMVEQQICPTLWLAGNHDWYIATDEESGAPLLRGPVYTHSGRHVDGPRESAFAVVERHQKICQPEIIQQLRQMACRARPLDNVFVAHAVYYAPDGDGTPFTWLEYRLTQLAAAEQWYQSPAAGWPLDVPVIHIGGHTHIPALWERSSSGAWSAVEIVPDQVYSLQPKTFYHVNVGSVGFPRGRFACPNFALLDTESWSLSFHTTSYDVEAVREIMQTLKYPSDLYDVHELQPCLQEAGE